LLTLGSAQVAEILSELGFDWLFVDCEHAVTESRDLLAILQAVGARAATLVRVPNQEASHIQKALDLGATGVIVPMVNTPEQAALAVRHARYAPGGIRGVGVARAHGYGLRFGQYSQSAESQTVVVLQCEHVEAVLNIEQIAAVPGVDAIFIGPYDLSSSLGCLGQLQDPAVVQAIDRVTACCRAARMPLGAFGLSAPALRPFREKGYTLLAAGIDTMLVGESARALIAELRRTP
jgi:2-keto-3-deoxy-L-rhamnonate aldolase RhmA